MAKELTDIQIMVIKTEINYAEIQMADIEKMVTEDTARGYGWKESDFERRMIDLLLMHRGYREKANTLKEILKRIGEEADNGTE